MKFISALFAFFMLTLGAAGAVPAQSNAGHGSHGAGTTQAQPAQGGSGHAGMPMDNSMIMLGTVNSDGIKAMAHLQSLRQNAAQHTAPETHNFMVAFAEESKGSAITQGRAAVKVTGPDGKTGGAVTLNPKEGFFSTDLNLKNPGRYTFTVGTKLTDGNTRQFIFSHGLK